jgi:hypothetical protein
VIGCWADGFPECSPGRTPFCVCRTDCVKSRRAGPVNSSVAVTVLIEAGLIYTLIG